MKKLSTLFCSIVLTGSAFAQIPNASFESWTAHTGYDTPDQWGNLNSFTGTASVYTCEKGTPGASGASYIKLTSKTVVLPVAPGIAVTGSINTTTLSVSGGFAYTLRPASLTGQWQYATTGTDSGHVMALLTKWNLATNKRDTVAFANKTVGGTLSTWTAFTINLNYYSGKLPDTAMILLASSGTTPVANNSLYIDTLAFAGNVPSGVVTVNTNSTPSIIYPNPSGGNANLYYYSITGGNIRLSVLDFSGRLIKESTTNAAIGENNFQVNVSGLVHGMYVLRIADELGGVEEKKFIVK